MKRVSVRAALLAAVTALVVLAVLSASTYAWFSFRMFTNVTPLIGRIGSSEGNLLIASERNGEYGTLCSLRPVVPDPELLPLTTPDMERFYAVRAQNPDGIALAYAQADERARSSTLYGTLYLKGEDSGFDVYLWRNAMSCGADAQALAALRLGLRIHTGSGTSTHIFRLDELADTSAAEKRLTIPTAGQIVSAIAENGAPTYQGDPSHNLSEYFARGTDEQIERGARPLCSLADGEIAEVEFRLWLEGCDENCINSVQGRDLALQLAFAGVEHSA